MRTQFLFPIFFVLVARSLILRTTFVMLVQQLSSSLHPLLIYDVWQTIEMSVIGTV